MNDKNGMAQEEVTNATNLLDDAYGFLADARRAIDVSRPHCRGSGKEKWIEMNGSHVLRREDDEFMKRA